MEATFWHNCWQKNSIGFHQDSIHPFLAEYIAPRIDSNDAKVFVPLCGKSLDMFFWAEHMKVDGCELSEIACRDFFKERDLTYTTETYPDFTCYQKDEIRLFQGDIFNLNNQHVANFSWIYDRAALIALPKALQAKYVDYIKGKLTPGVTLALITLEFPEHEMSGPPFPVFKADVQTYFSDFNIMHAATRELTDKQFARRTFEVSSLVERLYFITAKNT